MAGRTELGTATESTLHYPPKEDGCPFCHFGLSNFPHLTELGVPGVDRYTVAETRHFWVKPDVLPGNPEGKHILIIPRPHVYNYAGLAADSGIVYELGGLMRELEARFGPLVIFEHGGLGPGQNHQSIYHAHFHAYAGLEGVDVISYMHDMLNGGLEPDGLVYPHVIIKNLKAHFNGNPTSYLYIEQGPWAIYAPDPNGTMRSQITQRAMHLLFSGLKLDWKKIEEHRGWGDDWGKLSAQRIMSLIDFCQNGQTT